MLRPFRAEASRVQRPKLVVPPARSRGAEAPRDDAGNHGLRGWGARATHVELERYVFVGDGGGVGHVRLGSALVEIGARGRGSAAASRGRSFACFAPAAQQHQVLSYDFSLVVLLPVL